MTESWTCPLESLRDEEKNGRTWQRLMRDGERAEIAEGCIYKGRDGGS